MSQDRIYRFSSIGRRLDRRSPTNRAVMIIMPVAGLVAAGWAFSQGDRLAQTALAFFVGAVVAFLGWALGRELDPHNERAAFVSLLTAFAAYLAVNAASITLVFATLMLVRIVNRSTGLPAKLTDSIAVTLLACYTVYATGNPYIGIVAAIAFAFDAMLAKGRKTQWVFAVACAAASGLIPVRQVTATSDKSPAVTVIWLLALALLGIGWAIVILRTRQLRSTCDATGERMSPARARAGMLVGLLFAAQSFLGGPTSIEEASLIWGVLAGLLLSPLVGSASATTRSPEMTGTKTENKS